MAWNEPGKSNNNKDENQEGPPELDKIFKALGAKISALLGRKPAPAATSNGTSSSTSKSMKPFVIGGLIIIVLIWSLSGIFIVSPAEKAVVLQFGKYTETVGPGPHWLPTFVQSESTVNVQKIATYSYSAQMLTKDQNIVDVSVAVQYRVSDAQSYLYNVINPESSLQQATASALRQVIGNTTLDQVLTTGRAVVRDAVVVQLENILQIYNAGIQVTDVSLQPAQAPAEVKAAFDDAIKAQEDEQRYQNQAQTYANNVVPIAQGQAKRTAEEAKAYAQQVVLQAQGDVARFNAEYSVYQQAPAVTKERLYIAAIEKMLQNSSKVLVDTKGNNNMLYLPLDKIIQQTEAKKVAQDHDAIQPLDSTDASDTTDQTAASTPAASSNFVNPDSLVGRGDRP